MMRLGRAGVGNGNVPVDNREEVIFAVQVQAIGSLLAEPLREPRPVLGVGLFPLGLLCVLAALTLGALCGPLPNRTFLGANLALAVALP